MISITVRFFVIASLFIVNSLFSQITSPIQITTSGAREPTVSPDDKWIAFQLLDGGVAKTRTDGTQYTLLTNTGWDPDWSRSNNLIVSRYDGYLFTIHPLTGDTTNIRYDGFDDNPAWKPDGTEIAIEGSIKIVSYPSGNISTIPCMTPGGLPCAGEGPTWSPDGNWIGFEDGIEILKVSRSGGTAEVVVATQEDVSFPSWSPNGNWIAFAMDEQSSSNTHIWVTDSRGTNWGLWQVTTGIAEDFHPTWSSNSDTIFFSSLRSGQLEIWKIPFQSPTSIEHGRENNITDIILHQNYPNPFNPTTKIMYSLPRTSEVVLKVFDIIGREVKTLVNEVQLSGVKTVIWDGTDNHGDNASSGIYLYNLRVENTIKVRKMLLLQ